MLLKRQLFNLLTSSRDMDLRRRYLTYAGLQKSDPLRGCLLLSWGTESRLKGSFENANSLTDFYYSIRGLVLLKDQTCEVDVQLGDADRIFPSIKALGRCDGRWRLSSNNPESSNSAAGNALEALAGVISLASPQIDHSLVRVSIVLDSPAPTLSDFLGLVEKFFYLSGKYGIQLTVGDSGMENSFLQPLGHVELDLPDAPEKAARPPPQPVDPLSRYGPKAEISHIFRAPEKRPPKELSLAFLGLVFLPFFGFLAGLIHLRANLKNFPKSTVPSTFAILFHLGIAAVLALYALFWFKLDLFTTLKALGLLGMFLLFVGHKTLSHLASTSSKLKSA